MIPLEVVPEDLQQNTDRVIHWMENASRLNMDVVLFPEAALTGLRNVDDPFRDLSLGIEVHDPMLQRIAQSASHLGLYVGLGFLERCGKALMDSAVLISPHGEVVLH